MFKNFIENRAVYQIMWKNTVEPDRPQMTIWHMRFHCWVPKATNINFSNMKYLMLFHCKNCYTNAPQCYVRTIFPALFSC